MKAIYKDDAVRCPICGVEVWDGVECDCGHEFTIEEMAEAYAERASAEKKEKEVI